MTNGNISPLRRRMAGDMTIRGVLAPASAATFLERGSWGGAGVRGVATPAGVSSLF